MRVYRRTKDGPLYVATYDPTLRGGTGGDRRCSLGHQDEQAAKAYADELTKELRRSNGRIPETPTAGRIFDLYKEHRTPDKCHETQKEDARQHELWTRMLGSDFDLSKLSRREWDKVVRQRRSGAIDGRGRPVVKDRRKVSDRTVQSDLVSLRSVCRWATEYRDDSGRLLLDRDPTRGLTMPRERNPNRPVATHDRVDAIRKQYRKPTMRIERGGKRNVVESYLPEVFEIVVGTGRRISAVCGLRYEDLDLEPSAEAPWGAIVWPSDTDKMKRAVALPDQSARARGTRGRDPQTPSCWSRPPLPLPGRPA